MLFILRSDSSAKHGGDTLQAQHTARALARLGVEVHLASWSPTVLRSGGPAHIFNIDRPFEFLLSTMDAGVTHVSTIHHAENRVARLRRSERQLSIRGLIARLNMPCREFIAFAARNASTPEGRRAVARAATLLPRLRRKVRRALESCATVFVLSDRERIDLSTDFGFRGRNVVKLPNASPVLAVSPLPWPARSPRVLVVGRIEPRKRQLDILLAAERAKVGIDFLGAPSPSAVEYFNRFSRDISTSTWCRYLGSRDHASVLELMSSRRVLLNGSWVEVQSLVEIESASIGCFVVSSGTGSTAELFPKSVHFFSDADMSEGVELAGRLARAAFGPPASGQDWSWADVAADIALNYRRPENSVKD